MRKARFENPQSPGKNRLEAGLSAERINRELRDGFLPLEAPSSLSDLGVKTA
jgi:hypothetical protein